MATNYDAAKTFLQMLHEDSGRDDTLRHVDVLRETALLAMAARLDVQPGNAMLWRQYLALEECLREACTSSEFDRLLDRIRTNDDGRWPR
jgi:hypothetical protein